MRTFRSLWATFLSLQGFPISSKDSSGVLHPHKKLLLDPTFSHLEDSAAPDALPRSSTVTASAAEAPHLAPHTLASPAGHRHCPWIRGRCAHPYMLRPRPCLLSPHAPLGCICPSHTPMVPFTAPVSFSPGNPRRLLCLFLSLSHAPSLCPTWDPPLCLFLPLPSHNQVSFSPQISAPFKESVSWITFLHCDPTTVNPSAARVRQNCQMVPTSVLAARQGKGFWISLLSSFPPHSMPRNLL